MHVVAGGVGFEPTTPNLGGWCSIRAELHAHREIEEALKIEKLCLCLEGKSKSKNQTLFVR